MTTAVTIAAIPGAPKNRRNIPCETGTGREGGPCPRPATSRPRRRYRQPPPARPLRQGEFQFRHKNLKYGHAINVNSISLS